MSLSRAFGRPSVCPDAVLQNPPSDADVAQDGAGGHEHRASPANTRLCGVGQELADHGDGGARDRRGRGGEGTISFIVVFTAASLIHLPAALHQRRKLERALQSPPLRSPSGTTSGLRPVSKASDLVPTDLAIAFTLIEGDLYSRITQTDCVVHLQQISGTRHIDAARKANNRIVNWVKKSVLRSDEVQSRSEVFKFFVNTAEVRAPFLFFFFDATP